MFDCLPNLTRVGVSGGSRGLAPECRFCPHPGAILKASFADAHFLKRFNSKPTMVDPKPSTASSGMGEAVAGSFCSGSGGGSACATCSASIEPVTCTATVLVSEPPHTLVAVIL